MLYPHGRDFDDTSIVPATKNVFVQGLKEGALIHPDGADKIWNSGDTFKKSWWGREPEVPIGAIFR